MSAFVEKDDLPGYTYKTEPVNDETIALERKWAHTTPHSTSDGYRVKIAKNFLNYHKIKEKDDLPGYTLETEPVNDETIALERKWAHTTPHSTSDSYRVHYAKKFLDYHKIKWE